jgi:hypothetical protein
MQGGNIINGLNTLQLGTGLVNKGDLDYSSGVVVGKMKRWFSNINSGNQSGLFPLGNDNEWKARFVKVEYTQATDGGSITAEWFNEPMGSLVTNEPITTNCNGSFTISNTASGYWNMSPSDGITNSENKTYNITLFADNLYDFSNDCYITAIKRDVNNVWTNSGTHIDNLGTATNPMVIRMNAKGWSNWGLGGEGEPLPVELLSMNLACNGNDVLFSWSTASEQNSESFVLEKSDNCIQWILSDQIPAAGFSNSEINYVINDNRIAGLNYYRLSQKDMDGKTTIYEPIYLDCQDDSPFKLLVWPNPEESGFHLYVNDAALIGKCLVSIRNMQGEVAFEQNIFCENGVTIFNFQSIKIPSGVYFIQVSNEHYFSEVIKLLVR